MFYTFEELERRAYINGRRHLAKAYGAADDAATAARLVPQHEPLAKSIREALKEAEHALERAIVEAASRSDDALNELQIGLDI